MVNILRLSTYMQVISIAFHPIFMPVYTFLSIWHTQPETMINWSAAQQLYFFIFLLLSYTVMPTLLVYGAYTLGWISTLRMIQNERRFMLLLLACWYMLMSTAWMQSTILPPAVFGLLNVGTMLLFVLWGLNFALKVSVHTASISTVAAYCIAIGIDNAERNLFELGTIGIACTGLVMSSRLYLKAHKTTEVYIGASTGLGIGTYGYTIFYHF